MSERARSASGRAGRLALVVSAVLFAVACREPSALEKKCRANDPSVRRSDCWAGAYDEGYAIGVVRGEDEGARAGAAECETSDTGDTGDTGDSGDTSDTSDSAGTAIPAR